MKRKKKHCYYYCDGYCFWNGDTGGVCDTYDNSHDGYCPMEESDRELEELAAAMIAAADEKLFEMYKKDYPCEEREPECESHDCSECEYYREKFEEHRKGYVAELKAKGVIV